ncbi:MAG TPA: hypothetical protein VHT96_14510 [Clostridia bacterium]|nr:hypothetical protein [Clostridia bacterium]
MLQKYWLTNEDAFFLTFLGAWCSVRATLWDNPTNFIILVASFLSFASIISQVRYSISTKDKDKKKLIGLHSIIGLFIILFVSVYFGLVDKGYLGSNKVVLLFIGLLWIGHVLIEYCTKGVAYKIVKQNVSITPDSN